MSSSNDASRLPFVVHEDFLETAFERRFQGILRHAQQQRSWHVIAAVPGSGKSLGINDLMLHGEARKRGNDTTRLPILAIRAPKNGAREQALGVALASAFGVIPPMPWYALRTKLVQMMAKFSVECIIIDDAQDLTLVHLAYLKELTDNLAAPPYGRQIGLCLVAAHSGNVVPLKQTFSRPEVLWRQFRWRMDTDRPFCIVLGHTLEEIYEILVTLEELYRSQLPDLQLHRWAQSIFTWLTHQSLDPDATRRVTMNHLTRLVISVLRRAYEQGATDIDATHLQERAELMILRRDEVISIDGESLDRSLPVQEVV